MDVPDDPGPVVQRAILINELQRLRQEHGSTQDQVAAELDWSPSKVIRIEGGSVGISTTDLRALLQLYGVIENDPLVERLTALARGARRQGWWSRYRTNLSAGYREFIGYEAGANAILSFQPLIIPGLLQTEEYIRTITAEFVDSAERAEIVVKVRLERQQRLFSREPPPRLSFIVDEAVLRRKVGARIDRMIMARQLRHLVEILDRPEISIGVIPFDQGAHIGLRGGFILLQFAGGRPGDVLFLENDRSPAPNLTSDNDPVAGHRAAFETLSALALPPEESRAFIEQVIQSTD